MKVLSFLDHMQTEWNQEMSDVKIKIKYTNLNVDDRLYILIK
jgi:hypothetical protein